MTHSLSRTLIAAATLAVATVVTTSGAFAYGSSTNDIDRRQAQQEQRIRSGVRDGSLTRGETRQLVEEQRRIQQLEGRAKADGRIDAREAAEIRRAQDAASKHIYQERHDSDRRGSGRWWGR
jgi:uncharacterized membrane protein YebE (DUF533 family)